MAGGRGEGKRRPARCRPNSEKCTWYLKEGKVYPEATVRCQQTVSEGAEMHVQLLVTEETSIMTCVATCFPQSLFLPVAA